MRQLFLIFAVAGLLTLATPAPAQGLLGALAGYAPVQLTYTCKTQTGSLSECSTPFTLPTNKLLVVQFVSGSATPIAPNDAGNFATDQASANVNTTLSGETANKTIGPHYAIANTAVWFFYAATTFYSDSVPAVYNNGGGRCAARLRVQQVILQRRG